MGLGVDMGNFEWVFWRLWMTRCQRGKVTEELGSLVPAGPVPCGGPAAESLMLTLQVPALPRSPVWLLFLGFQKLEPTGPLP